MAEIFRARSFDADDPERFLVIKRILPNLAMDDEFIAMFVDEARITVQLDHPNICQLYELGRLGDSYFIVMEHIAGHDLLAFQNHFRRQRDVMKPRQAAWVVSRIARGLGYAHRKTAADGTPLGIVHRDVSPQNILVSYRGDVKIIDFGIARARDRRQQTQLGVLKGKFGYMAPEQIRDSNVDAQSDVFATGIMLWELLTNRRLFYSKNSTEVLDLVQNREIPAPGDVVSGIPDPLNAITLKALQRDRRLRYRSADELAEDLERWLRSSRRGYSREELARWTCEAFRDELEKEREKRSLFAHYRTLEQVLDYQRTHGVVDTQANATPAPIEDFDAYRAEVTGRVEHEDVLAQGSWSGRQPPTTSASRLPDRHSVERAHRNQTSDNPRRSYRRFAILFAAILTLTAVAAFAYEWGRRSGLLLTESPVLVDVSPPNAAVKVDGTPVSLSDGRASVMVEPGDHRIVASADGYEPYRRVVSVADGEPAHVSVSLTPTKDPVLSLSIVKPGDRVFVDGDEHVADEQGRLEIPLARGKEHVVEISRPGFFVLRRRDTAEQLASLVIDDASFRPVETRVTITTDPAATVRSGGTELGSTADGPLVLEGLSPFDAHPLTIVSNVVGYQNIVHTIVFDGSYERRLSLPLPRLGRPAPEDGPGYGWLRITGPESEWYAVEIDGNELGLTTPFGDQRVALTAGAHQIVFARGGQRVARELMVEDRETLRLQLPLDGMPTHESSRDANND